MSKYLRSIQTHFPYLHDIRFKLKFAVDRIAKRPHEEDFLALRHFRPKSNEVFLDIGTNRGESLLSMSIVHGSKNKIIGFEPNPHVYKRAKREFRFRKHITIHNVGLSNVQGYLNLNVPFYRKWMFDGLSSFDYKAASGWLKTRLWNYNEDLLTIKELNCEVRTLDQYKLNPYFMKIDVQGLELQVLEGARETIRKHLPIILIESANEQIREYLKQFGYDYYAYEQNRFAHGIGKLNTFCIPKSKLNGLAA